MSMLLGFRPSSVTPILASCLGVNLVRAGVGATQNSAGVRALRPYGCGPLVIDSIYPKNGRKRNL